MSQYKCNHRSIERSKFLNDYAMTVDQTTDNEMNQGTFTSPE